MNIVSKYNNLLLVQRHLMNEKTSFTAWALSNHKSNPRLLYLLINADKSGCSCTAVDWRTTVGSAVHRCARPFGSGRVELYFDGVTTDPPTHLALRAALRAARACLSSSAACAALAASSPAALVRASCSSRSTSSAERCLLAASSASCSLALASRRALRRAASCLI